MLFKVRKLVAICYTSTRLRHSRLVPGEVPGAPSPHPSTVDFSQGAPGRVLTAGKLVYLTCYFCGPPWPSCPRQKSPLLQCQMALFPDEGIPKACSKFLAPFEFQTHLSERQNIDTREL